MPTPLLLLIKGDIAVVFDFSNGYYLSYVTSEMWVLCKKSSLPLQVSPAMESLKSMKTVLSTLLLVCQRSSKWFLALPPAVHSFIVPG